MASTYPIRGNRNHARLAGRIRCPEGMAPESDELSPETLANLHASNCRYSLPDRVDVLTVAGELDAERCPRCRYLGSRLPKVMARPRLRRLERRLAS
jgi:hypothetical protein